MINGIDSKRVSSFPSEWLYINAVSNVGCRFRIVVYFKSSKAIAREPRPNLVVSEDGVQQGSSGVIKEELALLDDNFRLQNFSLGDGSTQERKLKLD